MTKGEKVNRLTVLKELRKRSASGNVRVLVQCDCGTVKAVIASCVRSGHTKSCGCWKRDATSSARRTHGLSGSHPLYATWTNMKQRCYNPANPSYKDWGARGIEVCAEWRENFQAFVDHVSQLPRYGEKGMTLDRIDNNLGYFPGNVRWFSRSGQRRNQRRSETERGTTQLKSSRWQAQIMIDGEREYLGVFDTEEEAHQIYLAEKEKISA